MLSRQADFADWYAPGLRHNPEMVYALLHRQDVFEPFRMHARFADILDNIQVGILSFASWQLHGVLLLRSTYCQSRMLDTCNISLDFEIMGFILC